MAPSASDVFVRVTAGPTYDPSTHQVVLVNSATPTRITSETCSANISVRIQNYRGLPKGSPKTSSYFSHPLHKHDQYSISFSLLPKKTISGTALVFGNDIDHPVRDRLPYGTGTAFSILKRVIDPGLEGDLYADKPHLYGRALSSFNILSVGEKGAEGEDLREEEEHGDQVVEEGGEGEGLGWRKSRDVPDDAGKRKGWFLAKDKAEKWQWEEGRVYKADFFNPYLDFNTFSLKLPGFSLSVLGYLGGEDYLRYVLKNIETGDVLFVVVFSLLHQENINKEDAANTANKSHSVPTSSASERHEGESTFEPEAGDLD